VFLYDNNLSESLASPSSPVAEKETFDKFARHLKEISLDPWSVAAFNDTEIRIVLPDKIRPDYRFVLNFS
jgi:hypothetical protein